MRHGWTAASGPGISPRRCARLPALDASIVKACVAVVGKEKRARALLEKVPGELHQNLGYLLCRIQWLLNNEGTAEAVRLVLEAPREAMARQDTDQWWRERRVLARKLLSPVAAATADVRRPAGSAPRLLGLLPGTAADKCAMDRLRGFGQGNRYLAR